MEFSDVARATFTCRDWTDQPVTDDDIEAIIEIARFAPSGGNRQPARVVAVRSAVTKAALRAAAEPAGRVYYAQTAAGEAPWNTINPTSVDAETLFAADDPMPGLDYLEAAPVALVVGADLSVIASMDANLDRVGVISGASIYPFVWSMLMAARDRGMAGVMTTMAAANEAEVQELVGFPPEVAVATVVMLGYPTKVLTKLRRGPVDELLRYERWV